MDLFGRVFSNSRFRWLNSPFGLKKHREKPSAFTKYEHYAYKFQSIVIWEHPTQTVSCLLLIQLLFWMIVNLCWKFYGIIFTLLLIFCTHDVWTDKIWPEIRLPQQDADPYREELAIHPRILTMAQIEEYFNNLIIHAKMTWLRFKNLRNSHPTLFCSLLSACFGFLTVVGCAISGIWLLYMLVMGIFLGPGIYIYILPPSLKTSLRQYFYEFVTISSFVVGLHSEEDDDYVPQLSTENLDEAYAHVFQLNDPGNDFSSIDQDELLVPSLDAFDESSLDELDHLISSADRNLEFSEDGSESSDTSMKFSGGHFENSEDDRDVSSDEENETAFLPNTPQSGARFGRVGSLVTSMVENIPSWDKVSRNLLPRMTGSPSSTGNQTTSFRNSAPLMIQHSKNNTDDEFEFINESDLE